MAHTAVAGEAVRALRRDIARIEGRLEATLPAGAQNTVLRRDGVAERPVARLATGALSFDLAIGGGLPAGALIELYGALTRDAGAVSGFAAAMARLALQAAPVASPLLWIATTEMLHEAGAPYAAGLQERFGIEPGRLFIASATRPADVLWIADEAARIGEIGAIVVELRGRPSPLDLTATRRLHRRAEQAGHPVILLRHAAADEPTAAPLRFRVAPAPACERATFDGPLEGSIGPPRFRVSITKSRPACSADFVLEWNSDERRFLERPSARAAAHPRALVPAPVDRQDSSPAVGSFMALRTSVGGSQLPVAARAQPSRREHAADRRARRNG